MEHRIQPTLERCQWLSLAAGGVGAIVCAVVALREPDFIRRAYLYAFLCCWIVTMGSTGLLALGNLTGGRWAALARPYYLAAVQLLPLLAVLFIPIALNVASIYTWAQPITDAQHPLPRGKAIYLEPTFFVWRAIGYFAVWLALGWGLQFVSRLDRAPADTPAMRRLGAIGLVLLVPTATFAAFDWGMSLEPHWYSSIYGALLTAGGVLAAHALAIASLVATSPAEAAAILAAAGHEAHSSGVSSPSNSPLANNARRAPGSTEFGEKPADAHLIGVIHDLGNLLLAFLMVWAYFAFSQFLIIWAANLPSEIAWYIRRLENGWQWLALAIVLFHFFAPFALLLPRDVKRTPRRLAAVATLLLLMECVNIYWTIVPAFPDWTALWHISNVATLVALGGLWFAAYCWLVRRRMRQMLLLVRN